MGLEPTKKLFLREPRLPIPPHQDKKFLKQVPTGIEPATLGLTDPRSTTKLRNIITIREKRDLNPHHVGRQPSTLPLSYSPH